MANGRRNGGDERRTLKEVRAKRKLVAPDERLLAPVPVDFAVMTTTEESILHTLYQTRMPPSEEPPKEVEAVLVGRFQYGRAHLKGLVRLIVGQFIALENLAGRRPEESAAYVADAINKGVAAVTKPRGGKPS